MLSYCAVRGEDERMRRWEGARERVKERVSARERETGRERSADLPYYWGRGRLVLARLVLVRLLGKLRSELRSEEAKLGALGAQRTGLASLDVQRSVTDSLNLKSRGGPTLQLEAFSSSLGVNFKREHSVSTGSAPQCTLRQLKGGRFRARMPEVHVLAL
eukprot:1282365-Rhodomonas_salina.2